MIQPLTMCPHCGYDLHTEEPIARGPLVIDPRGDVRWHGEIVRLTPSQRIILSTLARVAGRYVPRAVLAERIGYEGDKPGSVVGVHLHRLRQLLPGSKIVSAYNFGTRWVEAHG